MTGTVSQRVWDTASRVKESISRPGRSQSRVQWTLSSSELRAADPAPLKSMCGYSRPSASAGLQPQIQNTAAPGATRCARAKVHVHVGFFHFKPVSFKGQPDIKGRVLAGVRVSLLPPHFLTEKSGCRSAPPQPAWQVPAALFASNVLIFLAAVCLQ